MRLQKEFKPDREGASLLSRLYITQKQRKSIYKWALYALVLLVLSVLQDVVLCRVRLMGATTDLVPCAIILICVLEGAESGAVFSLVASLLYLYSGTAPGPYCVVFLVIFGLGISIFRQAYLQSGFGAALLCVTAGMLIYEFGVFLIGLFLGYTMPERWLSFLITVAMTLLCVPLLYPVLLRTQAIGGQTWKE
jgi:hypothetical protein